MIQNYQLANLNAEVAELREKLEQSEARARYAEARYMELLQQVASLEAMRPLPPIFIQTTKTINKE